MNEVFEPSNPRKGVMPGHFSGGRKCQKSTIGQTSEDKAKYAHTTGLCSSTPPIPIPRF